MYSFLAVVLRPLTLVSSGGGGEYRGGEESIGGREWGGVGVGGGWSGLKCNMLGLGEVEGWVSGR